MIYVALGKSVIGDQIQFPFPVIITSMLLVKLNTLFYFRVLHSFSQKSSEVRCWCWATMPGAQSHSSLSCMCLVGLKSGLFAGQSIFFFTPTLDKSCLHKPRFVSFLCQNRFVHLNSKGKERDKKPSMHQSIMILLRLQSMLFLY